MLLGNLGAEIAIVGRPVGADNGEGDVVPDAGGGLRREKIAAGGLEECQHRPVFKGGRGGEVTHHLCAGHGFYEALAGDAVDAGLGRGGEDLVATLAQN